METIRRTIRIPVERPDDETWRLLRAVACKAARFGNLALADQYSAVINGLRGDALKRVQNASFARMNDELSGWVRGAMMQNMVRGYWKRSGKDVLAGRERLACFSADGALTIAADQSNNRGVLYERDGERFVLACRIEPVEIRDESGKLVGRREPVRLVVALESSAARKDLFIREAVEAIWSGAWKPGVLRIRFDRRRRKIDVLISHSRPKPPESVGATGATLGPLKPDTGELWLRFDNGARPVNYGGLVNHMATMKANHAQIVGRLRRRMGNRKGQSRQYRRKLDEIGHYGTWARGKMHQLSAWIVKRCRAEGVGELRVMPLGEGDLPWHTLMSDLRYKCEENGIRIVEPDIKQDATARAERAEIGKRARSIRKAREGLAAQRELLRAVGEATA